MLNLVPDLSLLLLGLFSCLSPWSFLFIPSPFFFTDPSPAESRYQGKVLCRLPAGRLRRILSSIDSQHAPGQFPCLPLHLVLKMKFYHESLKRFDKSQSFYLRWVCGFDVIASGQPMTGLNVWPLSLKNKLLLRHLKRKAWKEQIQNSSYKCNESMFILQVLDNLLPFIPYPSIHWSYCPIVN